jgi:transposase
LNKAAGASIGSLERMNAAPTPPPLTSLEQARGVVSSMLDEMQQLRWRVTQLEQQLYGTSSEGQREETFSKEQVLLSLFPPPAPAAAQEVLVPAAEEKTAPRPRRHPLAQVIETVTQRIEPEEKVCPHCGKEKCEIGCEKSERYEYIPAKIIRHELVRPKLACACGEAGVSIAPLPPQLIEQGRAGASLVAHVLLSKYDDHLPLYRQEQQLARLGVNICRQTLSDWVEHGARWLQPIVREMKRELLAGSYLQVDETPVKVMDPEVKGRCAQGWLWVAGVPGGDVLFEFHPGRGKAQALELLGNFGGHLQRDGYSAYGALVHEKPEIIPVGCWAHARRKFIEAAQLDCAEGLEIVSELRQLYFIERRARDEGLGAEARLKLRQQLAAPILQALQPRLEAMREKHLPQSPLGKAIRYTLSEWVPLTRYLKDGRLEIDNNLTENAIRPSAVGKKNWLFIGHPEAGWRSAVLYSVIASCRRRNIDPWAYLKDVLARLPGLKQSELRLLLPAHWQPASAKG